jgi:CheY-like chemotaxis protein
MSRSNGNGSQATNLALARQQVSTPVPGEAPLRILVAEDNDFNSQLLEQMLVRRGHTVRLANNGRAALSLLKVEAFDVLLLDVHMPELDGFQAVRAIRERESSEGGRLPVIALTARSRTEDRERCLSAGMDDFLTKPVRLPELLSAMERVVRGNRRTGSLGALLTPKVLLAACESDAALLSKLCHWFHERAPEHIAALAAARETANVEWLRDTAHKLTAMLATFSAIAGQLASSVEDQAAAGEVSDALDSAARLESAVAELIRETEGLTLESLRAIDQQSN